MGWGEILQGVSTLVKGRNGIVVVGMTIGGLLMAENIACRNGYDFKVGPLLVQGHKETDG